MLGYLAVFFLGAFLGMAVLAIVSINRISDELDGDEQDQQANYDGERP